MTTTTKKPKTATDADPSPARAVSEVLGEDEIKPVSDSTERVRRYRERKRAEKAVADAPIVVSPGDVAVATNLGNTLWSLTAPMFRLRSLDEAQQERLGYALAPLVVKYMPMLGNWQYEAAALLCVFALVKENAIPKEGHLGAGLGDGNGRDAAAQHPDGAAQPDGASMVVPSGGIGGAGQ